MSAQGIDSSQVQHDINALWIALDAATAMIDIIKGVLFSSTRHFKLNEESGTVVYDYGTSPSYGTIVTGVTKNISDAVCPTGKMYSLDDDTALITFGDEDNTKLQAADVFSISFFYQYVSGEDRSIFGRMSNTVGGWKFWKYNGIPNGMLFSIYQMSPWAYKQIFINTGSINLNDGNTHHVVLINNGISLPGKAYIDKISAGTDDNNLGAMGTIPYSVTLTIGNNDETNIPCKVGNIRIFNGVALSEAQVAYFFENP